MTIGISWRTPRTHATTEWRCRFQKVCATDLVVAFRGELCADEIPLVRVEEHLIATTGQVNARAAFQVRDGFDLPDSFASDRIQTDEFAGRQRGVNAIAHENRARGVTKEPL